jgi:hypothetical protein
MRVMLAAQSVFGQGTWFPLANNARSAVGVGRRKRTVFELRAAIRFVGLRLRTRDRREPTSAPERVR